MRDRRPFRWPAEQRRLLRRAKRLEIATLFFLTTIIAAMYFTMSGSQAMKTAWIEDMLGLVPAIAFLLARRFEDKPPDDAFPFGYYKVVSIAYLVSATALVLVALYMIYDSGMALIAMERPTIGLVEVFGYEFWAGWLMIAALAYSIVPPVILGRMKMPLGRKLHDNVLMADAAMQQADWMTAGAAIVGIIGVGFGLWWADAAAALLIALDVMNDGRRHIVRATAQLADHEPRQVEGSGEDPAVEAVREAVLRLPWVRKAELQLRDEGRVLTGVIFLSARDGVLSPERLRQAEAAAENAHWRVYDPTATVLA